MARRRHSTALFEVISAGKKANQKPAAVSLRTPRWWFKNRKTNNPDPTLAPPVDPDDPTANITAATLFAARQKIAPDPQPEEAIAPVSEPADPFIEPPAVEPEPVFVAPPRKVTPAPIPAPVRMEAATPRIDVAPAMDAAPPRRLLPRNMGARAGMNVAFDGDHQEVTLKMRYTTALVSAFTVLVIVGLAYVIGRHMAEGPARSMADPPPAKPGGTQPGVLDVSQRQPQGRTDGAAPRPGPRPNTPVVPVPPASNNFADAKLNPNGTAQRMNNMNYVMIQSYPQNREAAYKLRNFLTSRGIVCTVERSSSTVRVQKDWVAVVGIRGFPPKFGQLPEYVAYRNAIEAAAALFPAETDFDKVNLRNISAFKWSE